jgi:hypothetical protein
VIHVLHSLLPALKSCNPHFHAYCAMSVALAVRSVQAVEEGKPDDAREHALFAVLHLVLALQ